MKQIRLAVATTTSARPCTSLHYCMRYYDRQFITRMFKNKKMDAKIQDIEILDECNELI